MKRQILGFVFCTKYIRSFYVRKGFLRILYFNTTSLICTVFKLCCPAHLFPNTPRTCIYLNLFTSTHKIDMGLLYRSPIPERGGRCFTRSNDFYLPKLGLEGGGGSSPYDCTWSSVASNSSWFSADRWRRCISVFSLSWIQKNIKTQFCIWILKN